VTGLEAVAIYSVLWATFGVGSGWVANRIPACRLDGDTWITKIRPFEDRGSWYARHLRVRVWKRRLPEAGALFQGGVSKASLPGFGRTELETFARETRRAELVHWANVGFGATFLVWNPWPIGALMVLFGLVAHLPFVVVQRYNRARAMFLLERVSPGLVR